MTGSTCRNILLALFFALPASHAQDRLVLTIDHTSTWQVMHNFGASDAWACQFAGNWPKEKKQQMADWLFSLDTSANGQPKGIGLSMWRFNLGAGSAQQGPESGIRDEWRRAESFLEKDGSYNWERQAGQQWFLTAARQRGVPHFLAFFNSPPVAITRNKKAFADSGRCNIDSLQYNAMAVYAANAIKGVQQRTGVLFGYISPVNEPQWDWSDGGQEGCPYTNREIKGLVQVMSGVFRQQGIRTKIVIPEAGHIKYLLSDDDKPDRGNQIDDLMRPGAEHYVGKVPLVEKVVAGHSYFSTSPYAASAGIRQQLAARVKAVKGLSFWQSEYCILGDNEGEIEGRGKDTGMRSALYLARTIHTDLTVANATAWQWWLAISPYNYKDGLIYIEKNKTDGHFEDSRLLWALGNYSRFIRPGMQRISASLSTAKGHLFVSAWKGKRDKKTVVVIVNTGNAAERIDVKGKAIVSYTTSANERLAKAVVAGPVQVNAESIVTLVIEDSK